MKPARLEGSQQCVWGSGCQPCCCGWVALLVDWSRRFSCRMLMGPWGREYRQAQAEQGQELPGAAVSWS